MVDIKHCKIIDMIDNFSGVWPNEQNVQVVSGKHVKQDNGDRKGFAGVCKSSVEVRLFWNWDRTLDGSQKSMKSSVNP